MARVNPPEYQSGDLRICPALGHVSSSAGKSVRLGPVNMRVLEALVARAGEVVSRGDLYAAVWQNQVVGEDALTRCISDIRADLRNLSGREDWIETLPKRGYRWTAEVSAVGPSENVSPAAAAGPDTSDDRNAPKRAKRHGALRLAGRSVAYLVALLAMAIVLVWSLDRFSGARTPVVAVLPIAAEPDQSEIAARLDLALTAYLMEFEQIRVLSRSAIAARPSNPFPFFYYEFGARWLIEGDLRPMSGHRALTITVADARTGIVEMQLTERITDTDPNDDDDAGLVSALTALGRFIDSQAND